MAQMSLTLWRSWSINCNKRKKSFHQISTKFISFRKLFDSAKVFLHNLQNNDGILFDLQKKKCGPDKLQFRFMHFFTEIPDSPKKNICGHFWTFCKFLHKQIQRLLELIGKKNKIKKYSVGPDNKHYTLCPKKMHDPQHLTLTRDT